MPLSIQDLIKVVEMAKVRIQFVTEVDYSIIDADILLVELKKMEE